MFESRKIPKFSRAYSKQILLGSNTVEHNFFFRSSIFESYIAWVEHGREPLRRSSTVETYKFSTEINETYRFLVETGEKCQFLDEAVEN